MNAICESFESFKQKRAGATSTEVTGQGFTHEGVRYNERKLRRYIGKTIRFFIDVTDCAVCFDLNGEFITNADAKRPYNNQNSIFIKALDFNPWALRELYRRWPEPWHGKPWHVHLAGVLTDIVTENANYTALPWHGDLALQPTNKRKTKE